jgi:hypothetical protein
MGAMTAGNESPFLPLTRFQRITTVIRNSDFWGKAIILPLH